MSQSLFVGRRRRRGAMIVFVAVSMVALLGMLAISIDVGAAVRQRRIAQTAADAAALGGGQEIYRRSTGANIVASALDQALDNGFPASEVTVNYPPSAGAGALAGNPDYVEVSIARNAPTIFGTILGQSSVDIRARSVAGAAALSDACIYALSSSGDAIDMPNGSELEASGCSITANGSIDAFRISARSIGSGGSISAQQTGNAIVRTGLPPIVDPYAYLTVPAETVPACDFTNTVISVNTTLNEGVYCGGITIQSNARATLNPGTYVLRGGGIDGAANNSELYGTGVTIINTNGVGNDASAFRPIKFGNTCSISLSAPTAGSYKGIVIYGDPAGPATGVNSINELCGVGEITGTIYMPTQTFKLGNSNGKFTLNGTLVAGIVSAQNGGGSYTIQRDPSGNSGIKRISLVQ